MLHYMSVGFMLVEALREVLKFDLDRDVPPELQNPYPFLRVIFAQKGTHF